MKSISLCKPRSPFLPPPSPCLSFFISALLVLSWSYTRPRVLPPLYIYIHLSINRPTTPSRRSPTGLGLEWQKGRPPSCSLTSLTSPSEYEQCFPGLLSTVVCWEYRQLATINLVRSLRTGTCKDDDVDRQERARMFGRRVRVRRRVLLSNISAAVKPAHPSSVVPEHVGHREPKEQPGRWRAPWVRPAWFVPWPLLKVLLVLRC